MCPLPPNAQGWIRGVKGNDCPQSLSRLWPGTLAQHTHALMDALASAGVASQRNGLRHSFISYRLALVQDAAKVALEAGTSPQMIFSNYRELVTPEEAREWFAVWPDSGQLELGLKVA